ncbi:uncharacterized protein K441DRAFT_315895 [Cenococcum geophilum 1.58]|uniref:uncharacterized protein n=1 Tax=Cenococcum geophilum 1.58 TaxID=794803 RepID=UPI00358F591E|nr:hypothetical protein K441DRAFT_315895 [Cenococcum geophilum 1.58]
MGVDVVDGLGAAPFREKPEHYQSGRESLDDGGADHATGVTKANSAINGVFDRSSPEFPLLLESDTAEENDAAEESDGTTDVEPDNGEPDYQENGYDAAAGSEEYSAGQHGDRDAAGVRALSIDDTESVRHKSSQAQDEPLLDDIGVTGGPSVTRKWTRALSADTIISSVEVLDLMPQPNLEDSRLMKRRRLAKRRAESLTLDPVSTPKSTPLPTSSGQVSPSGASNRPSPGLPGSDNKGDDAGAPSLPPNDLLDKENGDDGAHVRGTVIATAFPETIHLSF